MIRICKAKRGTFMVYENDMYLAKSLIHMGEFAEAQVELFQYFIRPGMTVVDAGANIGAHTVVFGRLGAFVHAYECQRQMFHLLCGNVAINGLNSRVECHYQALGNAEGVIPLPVMDLTQENNLGAFQIDLEGPALDTVEMVRLAQPCHFLKVDVEGYELEVLQGAEPMIRECMPVLYVENDREDKSGPLLEYIRSLGYTPYWHITDLDNPNNFNRYEGTLIGCQSIDLLCAPPGVPKLDILPEATTNERICHVQRPQTAA